MRLRRRIQYEAGIGIVRNVRAHEKLGWRFHYRFQSRRGNRRYSDNAPDPIDESQFHRLRLAPGVASLGLFAQSRPQVVREGQSRNPARLSGTILTSSSSTLTSMSSPSNPLMTTSSASDGSIHGVFMVLVLSCDEPLRSHHEHHCPTPQQIYRDFLVILRRRGVV